MMKISVCIAAALAIALPGSAAAACPTPADIDRGVYVVYSDNSYTQYQRAEDGVTILEDTTYVGDEESRFIIYLRHGYLVTSNVDFVGGALDGRTRIRSAYAKGNESYGTLAPNTKISDQITQKSSEGIQDLSFELESKSTTTLSIGGCTYEGIAYRAAFGGEDPYAVNGVLLKGLGITIFTGWEFEGDDDGTMVALTISTQIPQKDLLLK